MDSISRFIEKGQKFIGLRKDYNDVLQDADNYGLTISPAAVAEIVRLGVPEVGYFLARSENFELAHSLMNLEPYQQVVRIGQIAKQLQESGFANDPDTEDYIDARRQAKREEKRR